MEVLNHYQRRSAIWRLISLTGLCLAILATILFSTFRSYTQKGMAQLQKIKENYEREAFEAQKQKSSWELRIRDLQKELDICNSDIDNPDLAFCKKMLKMQEKEKMDLEKEWKQCNNDLEAIYNQ